MLAGRCSGVQVGALRWAFLARAHTLGACSHLHRCARVPRGRGHRRATRMRGLRAPVPRGRRLPPASCTSPLGLAPQTPKFDVDGVWNARRACHRATRVEGWQTHQASRGARTRSRRAPASLRRAAAAARAGAARMPQGSPRVGEQEHRHVIRPSMITGRGMGRCGGCRDRRATRFCCALCSGR
jgi:hypothetical protein